MPANDQGMMPTNRKALQNGMFLGIDGGGSQTTAWLVDEGGRILGRGMAGPSNPTKAGLRAAERHLVAAAREAIKQSRRKVRAVNAVCAGIAGADRPALHRKLMAALRRGIHARRYLLTTDAAIVLECALGNNSAGVIVISGTGSIAYGRDRSGCTGRCGGWGLTFDDAGSGYDLGRKAVMAALKDFDGRGPHTRLQQDLCRALKIENIIQVVTKPLTPREIAAFFPLVLRAAQQGDPVAKRLCQDAGHDLADLAGALLKRLKLGGRRAVPVVCTGGVFHASAHIRQSFQQRLHAAAPDAAISLLRRQPVEGALDLARRLVDGKHLEDSGILK